jgi:hypothetical protein
MLKVFNSFIKSVSSIHLVIWALIGTAISWEDKVAWSAILASDSASNGAYSIDATGAWKGQGSTEGENPPGLDNGGAGFKPWDFRGGYHNPLKSPYGNLNHFIDDVDFIHRDANDLDAPAFGLTNADSAPNDGFSGFTARATRSFVSPLEVGQTLSLNFDNPILQPLDPFASSGFLIRLNSGEGPIIKSTPLPGVVEKFGLFAASNFNDGRLYTTDSVSFTDTGVAPAATAVGTTFTFRLTDVDAYTLELRRIEDNQILFSRSGTLNNVGAGPIDCIEITLYSNGSSSTGSRELFFNQLRIENDALLGDYNGDGSVDAADFTTWRDHLGTTFNLKGNGDETGSSAGVVDLDDYELWKMHFGEPAGSASGFSADAAAPEPTTLALLTSAVAAFSLWRHRSL